MTWQLAGVLVAVFAASLALARLTASGCLRLFVWDDASDGKNHGVHKHVVSRAGGVAVVGACLLGAVLRNWAFNTTVLLLLLTAAVPVMFAGFAEDATHRVGASWRFAAACASAAILLAVMAAPIDGIGLPLIDAALAVPAVAFVFTVVGVAGIAHAVNLTDGLNGLAAVVSCTAMGAMGWAASLSGDFALAGACLVVAAATMGFFFVNFPHGRLFLGDGGAYFLGFAAGAFAVLLVGRNTAITEWFPVAALSYPLTDTLFSMIRRMAQGRSVSRPDRLHLHHLVMRRCVMVHGGHPYQRPIARNSAGSMVLWALVAGPGLIACVAPQSQMLCMSAFGLAVVLHVLLYRRLLRGVPVLRLSVCLPEPQRVVVSEPLPQALVSPVREETR